MSETLVLERHGHTLLLRLNRPGVRNALDGPLIEALGGAPSEVVPAALAPAERVAANAPPGAAACKERVRLYATDPARAGERRDHWRAAVLSSEDARDGATAFVEKRSPVWNGR